MSAENSTVTQAFLGIIAISTLVMAVVQVAFIIYGWSVARRVSRMLDQVEQELKPILGGLQAMARDAARASAMAVAQVERVDRLFTDLTDHLEQTVTMVRRAIITPLRDGAAIVSAIKAVLSIFKDVTSPAPAPAAEDEDTLFIG